MPVNSLPSIFNYSDYRQFLKDYYEQARAQNRKFSHRFIANRLGFASSSWFADLLKGRTNLGGAHLVKLAALLKLKDNEADYLEALAQYNQAESIEEKNRHFRKLMSFKEVKTDMVGQEKFEFYSRWYYTAIRELLFFHDFKDDYAALVKRLHFPVTPSQAREAIHLLERLGFIRKDAQGRHRPQPAILKKDSSFKSLYAANFLRTNMELAMQALELFQKEERHISAMTMSLSAAGFQKALSEIEILRKKLMGLMEEDASPEQVFQFNLQFFPMTR